MAPGLVTMMTHVSVKYQRSSTHVSKVISKVKVFKNGSNSKVKVTGAKCDCSEVLPVYKAMWYTSRIRDVTNWNIYIVDSY